MQIKAKVGGNTTSGEFDALAIFFTALARNKRSEDPTLTVTVPAGPAGANEVRSNEAQQVVEQTQVTGTTRRRRTKAEIEADAAANKGVPEVVTDVTQAQVEEQVTQHAAAEGAAIASTEKAVAETEKIDKSTGEINPPEEFETAGGKTYSEGDVQSLAAVIARSKGAQVVKDKIAELGKARIADLDQAQLNQLGAYLESQK